MMRPRRPLWLWKSPPWPEPVGQSAGERWPIILLYHSISSVKPDPWGVRVKPRHFAEHMAVLREHCHPMRLTDLGAALTQKSVPRRSVLVTFDDGYVDNLLAAKPLMQRHGVPGTVFVSSGYVDSTCEYWWDELERLFLGPGSMPARFQLTVGEVTRDFDIEHSSHGQLAAWRHRNWFAWHDPPTARHRVFREVWSMLRAAPSAAVREQAMNDLRAKAGVGSEGRPTRRCCTRRQLVELASSGIIEVGGHTVLHPSLGFIGIDEQRREITENKAALEDMLQAPMRSFAYPFGSAQDYSADTVRLLKEAGYAQACSNFPAVLREDVDRFQYPRRVVMDWTGEEFLQRLARWYADEANPSA